jgi:hypothetical protein
MIPFKSRSSTLVAAAFSAMVLASSAAAQPGPGGWGPGMMMGPGMMGSGMMGSGMCNPRAAGLAEWRVEMIERMVRPTDAQRGALSDLKAASTKAAETIAAACPRDFPETATARLELMEKRLDAMLQAVRTVRPAFDAFYATLTDDQKAALNRAGPGIGVGGGGTGGKANGSRGSRQPLSPTPLRRHPDLRSDPGGHFRHPRRCCSDLSFSGADRIEFSGTTGVLVAVRHQLATKRIERSECSRTVAATLPKNSVSPAGRPTPMTIRL